MTQSMRDLFVVVPDSLSGRVGRTAHSNSVNWFESLHNGNQRVQERSRSSSHDQVRTTEELSYHTHSNGHNRKHSNRRERHRQRAWHEQDSRRFAHRLLDIATSNELASSTGVHTDSTLAVPLQDVSDSHSDGHDQKGRRSQRSSPSKNNASRLPTARRTTKGVKQTSAPSTHTQEVEKVPSSARTLHDSSSPSSCASVTSRSQSPKSGELTQVGPPWWSEKPSSTAAAAAARYAGRHHPNNQTLTHRSNRSDEDVYSEMDEEDDVHDADYHYMRTNGQSEETKRRDVVEGGQSTQARVPQSAYSSPAVQDISQLQASSIIRHSLHSTPRRDSPVQDNTRRTSNRGGNKHHIDSHDHGNCRGHYNGAVGLARERGSRSSPRDDSPHASLYDAAMRALLAKKHWVTTEQQRQAQLEQARLRSTCTFRPQLSRYACHLRRPAALRPENRTTAEMLQRARHRAERRQQEVERELRECTFRPLTLRTARRVLRTPSPQSQDQRQPRLERHEEEQQHCQGHHPLWTSPSASGRLGTSGEGKRQRQGGAVPPGLRHVNANTFHNPDDVLRRSGDRRGKTRAAEVEEKTRAVTSPSISARASTPTMGSVYTQDGSPTDGQIWLESNNSNSSNNHNSTKSVFDALYRDATARHYFETVLRPQVIDHLQRRLLHRRPSQQSISIGRSNTQQNKNSNTKNTNRMDSLSADCVVAASPKAANASVEATHQPRICPRSADIVQCKVNSGRYRATAFDHLSPPRHAVDTGKACRRSSRKSSTPTASSQCRKGHAAHCSNDNNGNDKADDDVEAAVYAVLTREQQRVAQTRREAGLRRARYRHILEAKFDALGRAVAAKYGVTAHHNSVYRVVDVARATLTVLSPAEAEEALGAMQFCGKETITRDEFVHYALRHLLRSSDSHVPSKEERNGANAAPATTTTDDTKKDTSIHTNHSVASVMTREAVRSHDYTEQSNEAVVGGNAIVRLRTCVDTALHEHDKKTRVPPAETHTHSNEEKQNVNDPDEYYDPNFSLPFTDNVSRRSRTHDTANMHVDVHPATTSTERGTTTASAISFTARRANAAVGVSALLHLAPPPDPQTQRRRKECQARSVSSDTRTHKVGQPSAAAAQSPRLRRVTLDSAERERLRARRAERQARWTHELQHRRDVARGVAVDAEHTFRPHTAHLIPYACRPDVNVVVKLTRTQQLRRAYNAERQRAARVAAAAATALALTHSNAENSHHDNVHNNHANTTTDDHKSNTVNGTTDKMNIHSGVTKLGSSSSGAATPREAVLRGRTRVHTWTVDSDSPRPNEQTPCASEQSVREHKRQEHAAASSLPADQAVERWARCYSISPHRVEPDSHSAVARATMAPTEAAMRALREVLTQASSDSVSGPTSSANIHANNNNPTASVTSFPSRTARTPRAVELQGSADARVAQKACRAEKRRDRVVAPLSTRSGTGTTTFAHDYSTAGSPPCVSLIAIQVHSTPAGDFVRSLSSQSGCDLRHEERGEQGGQADENNDDQDEHNVLHSEGQAARKGTKSVKEVPSTAPRQHHEQTRLYRDVISEHAAFGDDKALAHLGRELLLKQLRDYHHRRG